MKSCHPVSLLLTAVVLLFGGISATSAADASQVVAEDALTLEHVEERFKQMDTELAKQVDAFVAVVDAEAAAMRVGESVGKLLRTLARAEPVDFRELAKSAPQDNATISTASKELEASFRLRHINLASIVDRLSKQLEKRVKMALLGKSKPEDIADLTQTVQSIRGAMKNRSDIGGLSTACNDYIDLLGAAKQLAEAGSDPSTTALSRMVEALQKPTPRNIVLTESEKREFIAQLLEPMRKSTEEKWAAVEAAIDTRKPAQEISTAIDAYVGAIDMFNSASHGADQSFSVQEADFYRSINAVLTLMGKSQYREAGDRLHGANNFGSSYNESRAELHSKKRQQMVRKIQDELLEKVKNLRQGNAPAINARIAAVKEPTDVGELLDDIKKMLYQMGQSQIERSLMLSLPETGGYQEDLSRLMEPLKQLKSFWEMSRTQLITREGRIVVLNPSEPPTPFQKEFVALHNRVLRTAYSNGFKSPELTKAPYVDLDPERAIETFCDDLAQRGEWRRLLDILQLRAPATAQRSSYREDEAITAIRSFLAGKNSELVEQWTDAVLAYKSVLRSTAPRTPIQAAADNIKAIAKAHPGAITEAADREKSNATPAQTTTPKSTARPGIPPTP